MVGASKFWFVVEWMIFIFVKIEADIAFILRWQR